MASNRCKYPVWLFFNQSSKPGFQNEDLIVWMRTAAFPTFRKLYRRIDHSEPHFNDGLPKGSYLLILEYSK